MKFLYQTIEEEPLIFESSDTHLLTDDIELVRAIAEHEMECHGKTDTEDWPIDIRVNLESGWQWFTVDMGYVPSFSVRIQK